MKYLLIPALLVLAACNATTAGVRYPTVYTGGPPPVDSASMLQAASVNHSAHMHHGNHKAGGTAYDDVMMKMHAAMGSVAPTGDADTDFALGMIPHHQGAVDMAEVLLQKGDDPKLRRMARDIIVAQKREIAFMKYWLATRGQTPASNVVNINNATP